MELSFIFYILISVIVISGSLYLNIRPGAMSKGIVMALLFILISVYFGLRWFTTSGKSNIGTNLSTTWPPPNSLSMCPDFTTLSSNGNQYAIYTCTDTRRVSTSGAASPATLKLNDNPTSTNMGYYSVNQLCSSCYSAGLTWEGVCIPNSDQPVNASASPPRPA
jgi:hypothetical protein